SNSVITTWQISFDYIRSMRPSAAELLSLMSFFDRQGIPEYLLPGDVKSEGRNDSNNRSGDDDSGAGSNFEENITTLRNYSLITVSEEGDAFEMHRLVQLSTRKWLEACGQLEKWKQQYITRLSQAFPTGA